MNVWVGGDVRPNGDVRLLHSSLFLRTSTWGSCFQWDPETHQLAFTTNRRVVSRLVEAPGHGLRSERSERSGLLELEATMGKAHDAARPCRASWTRASHRSWRPLDVTVKSHGSREEKAKRMKESRESG